MNRTTSEDVDEYIARFPEDVQTILEQVRQTIRSAAPEATERISYQMPAFHQQGNLVYYAAWKKHIGFYPPISDEDEALKNETAIYAGPKGNLKFPMDQPMPLDLITRIVKQRIKENSARVTNKRQKINR